VQEGQGYLVSPPLPFANFDELVEKRRNLAASNKIDRARVRVA
jgi:hypothetical protein